MQGISNGCTSCALDCTSQPRASLQLVAIPNAPSSSSGPEIQALKKRIQTWKRPDLDRPAEKLRCRQRLLVQVNSLSPHLLLPLGDRKAGKAGKAETTRGNVAKVKVKSVSQQSGPKNFEYLMKLPVEFREHFHERFHKKDICFNFQKKSCSHQNCKWAHICVGCGGPKPYDDCQCLSGKVR